MLSDRDKELIEYTIKRTLESVGYIKPPAPKRISQRKAYERFGRSIVDRWAEQGKIRFERRGVSANSAKTVLVEDLERIVRLERNLAIKIKQNLYK